MKTRKAQRWVRRVGLLGASGLAGVLLAGAASLAASEQSQGVAVRWGAIEACADAAPSSAGPAPLAGFAIGPTLTRGERIALCRAAAEQWAFVQADTKTPTGLPNDSLGFAGAPSVGAYTSPTDIAMVLWSDVAAMNLHLVPPEQAAVRAGSLLEALSTLPAYDGFLYSWYSPATGQVITGPGGPPVTSMNGQFISTVDNGWYASALVVVRDAFPQLAEEADALLGRMQFGIFYDASDEATSITAGQLYGGWIVGQGPAGFHYGLINTDPRIAIDMGIGLGEIPGNAWWRTWRTLPGSFTWQTQTPVGPTVTYTDPTSGQQFPVVEAHYSYDGVTYVPSWGGSEFEGLMASLVVPEAAWGTHGFGLNDANYAEASLLYARRGLGYPVWGLSPASVPGTTGSYAAYGAYPLGSGGEGNAYLSSAVAPYASFIALPYLPQAAFSNIERMTRLYPALSGPYGLYDAVDPATGVVAPRYLILDEGMAIAGVDAALEGGGLARYIAMDPVGARLRPYLEMESFSIVPAQGLHRVG